MIRTTNTLFPNERHESHNANENSKISFWLQKLFTQNEQVRYENTQRDNIKTFPLNQRSQKEVIQSGINNFAKKTITKKEEDAQILTDLIKKSNRSIIRISSGGLLNLFPDTINVEESRIIFKFNQFLSSQSHSVDIKDISNVFIESSLFYSTLQVVSRTYIQNDIKIRFLDKKKAIKVQNIIEGLRTFDKHNINTSDYDIDELIAKIAEFRTN